ncbi:MAG: hypothetical protein GC159_11940 [Phycisphaera sp.]|nr:hypothetical protein [Phycisphaera sp.]
MRSTATVDDDVELGQEIYAYAKQYAESEPESLVEFHTKIESLCKLSVKGYGTIVESLMLIANNVPDRREQSLVEAESRLLKMVRLVPDSDKKFVGNRLIDVQLEMASDYIKVHEWQGATTTYDLAIAKAQEMGLEDRVAQIEAKKSQIAQIKSVSALEATVRSQPLNFDAAKKLVLLYVVEMNQPGKAVEYRFRTNDEQLKELVYLASKGPDRVSKTDALRLGDWYSELAGMASEGARPDMQKNAATYYEKYLAMHLTDDAERQRVTAALASLGGTAPDVKVIKPREVAVADTTPSEPFVPKVPEPGAKPSVTLPPSSTPSSEPAVTPVSLPSKPAEPDEPAAPQIKTDASGNRVTATGVKLPNYKQPAGLKLPSGGLSLPGGAPSLPGAKPDDGDKPKLTIPTTPDKPAADPEPEPAPKPAPAPVEAEKPATPAPTPTKTTKPDTPTKVASKSDKPATESEFAVSTNGGDWIDLFADVNTTLNVNRGEWKKLDDGIHANPPTPAQLSLPTVPEGDYVVETLFERDSPGGAFAMQLPFGSGNAVLLKVGELHRRENKFIAGLNAINGKDVTENETTTPFTLESHRIYVARIEVHGFGGGQVDVKTFIDGKLLFKWSGSASSCSVAKAWGPPRFHPQTLGFATDQAGVIHFHWGRLKMLSGKATKQ